CARNSRKYVTGRRCIQYALHLQENVRTGGLCNTPVHIEHKGFVVSSRTSFAGGEYAVDIVATHLGFHADGFRVWTLVWRQAKTDGFITEIFAPLPGTYHNVCFRRLREIHICACVDQRSDVRVRQSV